MSFLRTAITERFLVRPLLSLIIVLAGLIIASPIVRADTPCNVLTDASKGSRLRLSSPIVNRSGKQQAATLRPYCSKTSRSISSLVWVVGSDGQLYNLKSIFAQAEVLVKLAHASTLPAATPAPTPPPAPAPPPPPPALGAERARPSPTPGPLTWENDFRQQFLYLQSLEEGHAPCPGSSPSEDCLDFATKLDAAAANAQPLVASEFKFPIGNMTGGQNGDPRMGVVIASQLTANLAPTSQPNPTPTPGVAMSAAAAATPVPVTPNVAETTTLTLYLANNPYQIVTFTQAVGMGQPLTYNIRGHLGPGAPACQQGANNHAAGQSYQDFCTSLSGTSLTFDQTNTEGGNFTFCSPATIPIPGAAGLAVVATGCKGVATLAYDVNATPLVGYARIIPNFELTLYGSLTANAVIVQGQATLELTLAKIDNSSAGFIYGVFNDPFHIPTATMLAYRPFAYYQATALPLNLTLSIHTIWGWGTKKTYPIYSGFSTTSQDANPLSKSDWYVSKIVNASP
ncbi:MAG TPA: hypothetical protein VHX17_06195 [Candidatus Cybelea sp.]|jgi:hypothetical protein|nr:hypothetical protein [Candidatus Cybelea sp.]